MIKSNPRKKRITTLKIKTTPTMADLDNTLRRACDPRSCLFNLAQGRALHKQLKGEITKVWVDPGHTAFSWCDETGARYRWVGDTPRWVGKTLGALDRWDRKGRKQGKPCPIREETLKPYTIEFRRLHKITPATQEQKDRAYARVQKARAAGKGRYARRRSLHDRVVGFAV